MTREARARSLAAGTRKPKWAPAPVSGSRPGRRCDKLAFRSAAHKSQSSGRTPAGLRTPLFEPSRGTLPVKAHVGSSAAFSESVLSGPSSATAVPNAAVPAATTAAVAAFFATLLTRVLAFEEGRTADLARANFVLAFAATFLNL